jgi:nucleotide-binding universal stress UspA family protein
MVPFLPFQTVPARRMRRTQVCGGLLTHISRVLAAIDFSKPARSAFEYALALSQHHRAELVVVQAVPPDQPFGWHARDRRALTERLRQRAHASNVEFIDRVQTGDPAEIILLHARSLRPDLIVLGTHQRRGIDRLRAGSIAERVIAEATAPVLLIPRGRQTGTSRPLGHVAVAVDFGTGTHGAVEHASTMASDAADRITLLHVVAPSSSAVPAHLIGYGIAESQDPVVRDAERRLDELVLHMKRHTSAAIHTRVLLGDTTTEISRAVDNIGADVLVVGVPKRGIVSRVLFGTTASRLLRAIRIPLIAVPDVATTGARRENSSQQIAA